MGACLCHRWHSLSVTSCLYSLSSPFTYLFSSLSPRTVGGRDRQAGGQLVCLAKP